MKKIKKIEFRVHTSYLDETMRKINELVEAVNWIIDRENYRSD